MATIEATMKLKQIDVREVWYYGVKYSEITYVGGKKMVNINNGIVMVLSAYKQLLLMMYIMVYIKNGIVVEFKLLKLHMFTEN